MPDTAAVRKCAGAVAAVDTTGRVVVAVGAAADSVERFAARGATAAGAAAVAVAETTSLGDPLLAIAEVEGTEPAAAGVDAGVFDEIDCCAPGVFGFGCGLGDLFLLRGALPVFVSSAAAGAVSLSAGVAEVPPV